MEDRHDPLNISITCHYEVKRARNHVDAGLIVAAAATILSTPGCEQPTTDHHAVGRVDGEGQLVQFRRARIPKLRCVETRGFLMLSRCLK